MESYLKIQNEVVDMMIKSELSGAGLRVVLCVLRKTNGWQKEDDWISFSQFQELTGLSRYSVGKEIKRLVNAHILLVSITKPPRYKVNPNTDSWVVSKTKLVSKSLLGGKYNQTTSVSITKPKVVSKTKPTKDKKYTNTKDTITKVPNGTQNAISTSGEFGNTAINELVAYFEGKLGASLDQSQQSNRRQCYNLLRKFKKDFEGQDSVLLVKRLINLALSDDFHSKNATSFAYLYRNALKIIATGKPRQSKIVTI